MREIRFRGKGISAHKGEWIYGFFKKNTHGDCYIENEYGLAIAVDPETVSQLACISAKSGEIYEGDYLEDDEGDVWEVVYSQSFNSFQTVEMSGAMSTSIESDWLINSYVTVIGNRWDNDNDLEDMTLVEHDGISHRIGDSSACVGVSGKEER